MDLYGDAMLMCRGFGVSLEEAASKARAHPVSHARHALWRMLFDAGWSGPYIARLFGVHHTTVYSALGMLDKKSAAPDPAEGGSTAGGRRTG